ncbi:hypothetical protein BC941DRAFT_473039 [Chlamydoabsidia padenii]|nr:hypothetical protein BC941DRAFT_473039 [Chlamydoabsidia padenii]
MRGFLNKMNGRNVPTRVIGFSLFKELAAATGGDTRQWMTMAYVVKDQGMAPGSSGVFVLHNKKRELPPDIMKNYFTAVSMSDQWLVYSWDAIDIDEHDRLATPH